MKKNNSIVSAPSVQVLNDKVFVTYAMQNKTLDWTMETRARFEIIPTDWFYRD